MLKVVSAVSYRNLIGIPSLSMALQSDISSVHFLLNQDLYALDLFGDIRTRFEIKDKLTRWYLKGKVSF